ncbi:metallophosphoesterase family protein [Microbulbifer taiwanensis]|uniref:metallophosphoesterase family protein n=1 Tax=Microbulbifer taiwanensis TaxID=986746 RepID=UPI00360E37E5
MVGDRTGGLRPGVFARAMDQLNWLQPEFVLSVGDHIEGYKKDEAEIARQWDEVADLIDNLQMPYFHVVGNHDISNEIMRDYWRQRLGRDYYHFVYRNVLFLALNTEDPPTASNKKAALKKLDVSMEQYKRTVQLLQGNLDEAREFFAAEPKLGQIAEVLRGQDRVTISDAQLAYVQKALEENPRVRWTFVLMHKPAWKYESPEFEQLETMLESRPYTVLAGHYHYYEFQQRNGRDYIQLGTTGGSQKMQPQGPGTMDHLMWISMTDGGPQIANIEMAGLHDRRGPQSH